MNHFKKYNELCNLITEYQYKIATLKERLYGLSGVSFDDIPKGSGQGEDIVFKIQEIDELITTLENFKEQKKQLYNKHLKEIELIDDEQQRSILRSYYLLRMSIKDISIMLDKSCNHVSKLKTKAMHELIEKMSKNDRR